MRALTVAFLFLSFSFQITAQDYWLGAEEYATHTGGALDGQTTWRIYIHCVNETDFLSSVSGDDEHVLEINTTTSWYQDAVGGAFGTGSNPLFFSAFPSLEFDSWLTIGAESSNEGVLVGSVTGATDPFTDFESGLNVLVNDNIGSSWFVLFPGTSDLTLPSFAGSDLKILVAQLTTDGEISGQMQIQILMNADPGQEWRNVLPIIYGGCTNATACNYDSTANYDDGSCEVLDACGVCGGNGSPCYGCIYVAACNYNPFATIDDGSCDFFCFGCIDESACNYTSEAIQDDGSCLYPVDIFGFDYLDCLGNCLNDSDEDGICDVNEILGCTDSTACNYEMLATDDDGSCLFLDVIGICGGNCSIDTDADGICDDQELLGCQEPIACNYNPLATDEDYSCEYTTCAGCIYEYACNFDSGATISDNSCEFGTCPGCTDSTACNYNPTLSEDDGSCEYCSCSSESPEGACICSGNILDECGVCGGIGIPVGDCDCDGNILDECGVCGGSGIPAGDCDCDGNLLDECGTCGGSGIPDGNCDCDGNILDECGTCGGSGIPEGDCDCNGSQLDAIGICGGDCQSDENNNGICDIYECNPESFCGPGTYWNEDTETCLITNITDTNLDGCTDLNDLMDLLSAYGICDE